MLHWRLLIGVPLVLSLFGICWLDARVPIPGIVLMPFFLICVFFLCKEILQLLHAGGVYPRRSTVYLGVFGTIVLCWLSCYNSLPAFMRLESAVVSALKNDDAVAQRVESQDDQNDAATNQEAVKQAIEAAEEALEKAKKLAAGDPQEDSNELAASEVKNAPEVDVIASELDNAWKTATFACLHILLAIAGGVLIAFIGEMLRFKRPGGVIINLSGAVFAIVYIGLLGSFIVLLRIAYGVTAVVSMIIVTKLCDIGAYTVGRLIGRHKMAPSLSPGKTIEGICGGLAFSILGAWFSTAVLFPYGMGRESQMTWVGIVVYGVAVGFSGAIGDLAESLIKRDVMRKDSGTNVPGFGGFLDIFDSLLISAPVAFGLWACNVIK